jgi:hypothetical protein
VDIDYPSKSPPGQSGALQARPEAPGAQEFCETKTFQSCKKNSENISYARENNANPHAGKQIPRGSGTTDP